MLFTLFYSFVTTHRPNEAKLVNDHLESVCWLFLLSRINSALFFFSFHFPSFSFFLAFSNIQRATFRRIVRQVQKTRSMQSLQFLVPSLISYNGVKYADDTTKYIPNYYYRALCSTESTFNNDKLRELNCRIAQVESDQTDSGVFFLLFHFIWTKCHLFALMQFISFHLSTYFTMHRLVWARWQL